jgi:hypothetical protein
MTRKRPPGRRTTTVMRLRAEENGTSRTRGNCRSSISLFPAASHSAVSVASPRTRAPSMVQLVHRAASSSSCCRAEVCAPSFPTVPRSSVTVMRFCVSVPVLSVQITLALPSVSTAIICRTIARRSAMWRIPTASTIVTTAGSPSGIAATARETAVKNISSGGVPCTRPITKITAHSSSAPVPSTFPVTSSFFCRGVCGLSCMVSIRAICPTWVCMPVATTMPCPWPALTVVEAKHMLCHSPKGAVSGQSAAASLCTGTLSPVRALSCVCSCAACVRRRSAGTKSPACSSTTSPGTRSSAARRSVLPPRTTCACGAAISCKAESAFSALLSCTSPITALTLTTSKMIMQST